MRPLIRRTPDGRRYAVPSTRRHAAPEPPRQATNGQAGQQNGTPPQHREAPEPRAKLTEDDVREARALHAAGKFGVQDLADIFGVGQSNMSCLIARRTWKHVTDEPTEQDS